MMISKTVGSSRSLQLLKRFYASSSSSNLSNSSNVEVVAAAAAPSSSPSSTTSTSSSLPVTGHKLAYSEYGDPSTVIRKERFQIDAVPENHIVVKMLAASVNPADINTVQGTYPMKPAKLPAVPGNEGVGMVIRTAAAPPTTNSHPLIAEGDWVIPRTAGIGTWQAYVHGCTEDFIKIPKMDLVTAATISVNPCTAYRMLKDFEVLKPGDCVIQNGGNSAVGQAVIQLCREFGLKCVSLVRPRDDFKQLKAKLMTLGNPDTIIITDDDLRGMMRDFKAQLALNCVGGKSATDIMRVLEEGRTMVTYGGMSRQPVICPTSSLIFNDIQLKGFWMTRWNLRQPVKERIEMLEYLSNLALTGKWIAPDHKVIPFAKYRDALENAMKGYTGVKYIIKFD